MAYTYIHATHVALHYITCTQNVHKMVVYLIWKVKVSKRWNISGGFVCHAMPTMSLVWSSGPLGCCFLYIFFLWFQARNTYICHTATHTTTKVSEHFFLLESWAAVNQAFVFVAWKEKTFSFLLLLPHFDLSNSNSCSILRYCKVPGNKLPFNKVTRGKCLSIYQSTPILSPKTSPIYTKKC